MASATYNQQEITESLVALVAFAGSPSNAVKALKAEGKRCPGADTLQTWAREKYAEQYEKIRQEHGDAIEKKAVADLRDIIAHAHDALRLAIEKTVVSLETNTDKDPAKTAANLATVADKMTRDSLTMQGRPVSIREDRNLEEHLRSLFAMGVLVPTESKQIPEAQEAAMTGQELMSADE